MVPNTPTRFLQISWKDLLSSSSASFWVFQDLPLEPADSFCLHVSPAMNLFLLAVLKVIKDRICLRALEKMIHQLADSKEQAEVLAATALQPLDVNADGAHAELAASPSLFVFCVCNDLLRNFSCLVKIGPYESFAV